MQPCSLAAVQPCSLAAVQPCSHAVSWFLQLMRSGVMKDHDCLKSHTIAYVLLHHTIYVCCTFSQRAAMSAHNDIQSYYGAIYVKLSCIMWTRLPVYGPAVHAAPCVTVSDLSSLPFVLCMY